MEKLLLNDSECRLMDIIWRNAPIESGKLVKLAENEIGWKKSTMYTVLRNLVAKGIVSNTDSIVRVLVERDSIRRFESSRVVARNFGGSLPSFITAFLGDRTLTSSEADELISLIESYRENA